MSDWVMKRQVWSTSDSSGGVDIIGTNAQCKNCFRFNYQMCGWHLLNKIGCGQEGLTCSMLSKFDSQNLCCNVAFKVWPDSVVQTPINYHKSPKFFHSPGKYSSIIICLRNFRSIVDSAVFWNAQKAYLRSFVMMFWNPYKLVFWRKALFCSG